MILFGALTVGAATLTFALMGLGSLTGATHRSNGAASFNSGVRRGAGAAGRLESATNPGKELT